MQINLWWWVGNSKNSHVFSFTIPLKSRKFYAREMYMFYSTLTKFQQILLQRVELSVYCFKCGQMIQLLYADRETNSRIHPRATVNRLWKLSGLAVLWWWDHWTPVLAVLSVFGRGWFCHVPYRLWCKTYILNIAHVRHWRDHGLCIISSVKYYYMLCFAFSFLHDLTGSQLVTLCHLGLPQILISDIRALWHSALSARVPECQKLKMYRTLDLDGIEHF